jgi:P-type Ca2+ transporter type 2C
MTTTQAPPTTATEAPTWHVLTRESAVQQLGVDPGRGLTSDEAAERLARYGPNASPRRRQSRAAMPS